MKRMLVVLGLLLVSNVFAQEKLDKLVFPEGYQQWPNVFHRKLALDDKNVFSYTVSVRLNSEKKSFEFLFVQEINGVYLMTTYFKTVGSLPDPAIEFYTDALAEGGEGYIRIDKQDPSDGGNKITGGVQRAVKDRFGLKDEVFGKIEDFIHSTEEDFLQFMEQLSESKAP